MQQVSRYNTRTLDIHTIMNCTKTCPKGLISEAEFDETASTVIKTPLPDDQTSGLLRRDDEDIEGEE